MDQINKSNQWIKSRTKFILKLNTYIATQDPILQVGHRQLLKRMWYALRYNNRSKQGGNGGDQIVRNGELHQTSAGVLMDLDWLQVFQAVLDADNQRKDTQR